MNPEVKQKWIAALRSNKYPQGKTALKSNGEFCCLGVLCDLHAQETGAEWEHEILEEEGHKEMGYYLGSRDYCPPKVVKWAGLQDSDPKIKSKVDPRLSFLNDNGATFEEIADLIEAEL